MRYWIKNIETKNVIATMSDKEIKKIALEQDLDSDFEVSGFVQGFNFVLKNFDFYKNLKSDADKYREIKKMFNK
tara:strand:- start:138 stop:359 length:222 start_codon:yes stop_codon:yes gene_type:complete